MDMALTQKQMDVIIFLQHYVHAHGFPPSIREIGEHFEIAPPSALSYLKALERKGFIRRFPLKPRCLEILKPVRDNAA